MCQVEYADFDMVQVHVDKHRVARKRRDCGECGRSIQPGESYHWYKQLCDGSWDEGGTCAHCQVAQQWLHAECGGWLWGGVYEDLVDHVKEEPRQTFAELMELGRLICGMQRCWRKPDGTRMPLPRLRAA